MKIEYHRLLLALTLAIGFLAVWLVVGMWASQIALYVAGRGEGENLFILSDGSAVVLRGKTPDGKERYVDLDGNPVATPEPSSRTIYTSLWPAQGKAAEGEPVSWSKRIRPFSDGRSPATFWYFMTEGKPDGAGWFVGYDSHSKRRVGYLGKAGFREDQPPFDDCFRVPTGDITCATAVQSDRGSPLHPEERLSLSRTAGGVAGWEVFVRASGGKVFRVDLRSHTVREFYHHADLRVLALVADNPHNGSDTKILPAVRLADAIVMLDLDGKEHKRYPISPGLRDRAFNFCQTPQGVVVLRWSSPTDLLGTTTECCLCWSSASGECHERTKTLTTANEVGPLPMQGILVPCPVFALAMPLLYRPRTLLNSGQATTYPEAAVLAIVEYWPALLVAQLIALAFAVLCYRRQRLYGATTSECLRWTVFVLLLGLPGWIGYRFGRGWPTLTDCASCASPVPYDRDECARCAVEFARPRLLGTEVFA